ncbi:MAG: hypothetical protein JXA90_14105 [Planctomycetes bacterium]|nr:hypothetical protein [Planctomycetota bacterium]
MRPSRLIPLARAPAGEIPAGRSGAGSPRRLFLPALLVAVLGACASPPPAEPTASPPPDARGGWSGLEAERGDGGEPADVSRPAVPVPERAPSRAGAPAPGDGALAAPGDSGRHGNGTGGDEPSEIPGAPRLPDGVSAPSPAGPPAPERQPRPPDRSPDPAGGAAAGSARPIAPTPAERVQSYLERLQGEPAEAERAYREIARAPAELIPLLVEEVDNPRPSSLRTLEVLSLQTGQEIIRRDDSDGVLYYLVRGMGKIGFDDIGMGPRRGTAGGVRIRYHNIQESFPVGVVLRGALITRFQSRDFPPLDDADAKLWWRAFHARVRDRL